MTCHICAGNTCLGECEPPIAYIENLEREVAELKAHINLLREALEEIDMQLKNGFVRCKTCGDQENTKDFDCRIWIADALASTPAQLLQAHDNEILTKEREEIIATLEYHGSMFADEVCEDYIRPRLLKGEL